MDSQQTDVYMDSSQPQDPDTPWTSPLPWLASYPHLCRPQPEPPPDHPATEPPMPYPAAAAPPTTTAGHLHAWTQAYGTPPPPGSKLVEVEDNADWKPPAPQPMEAPTLDVALLITRPASDTKATESATFRTSSTNIECGTSIAHTALPSLWTPVPSTPWPSPPLWPVSHPPLPRPLHEPQPAVREGTTDFDFDTKNQTQDTPLSRPPPNHHHPAGSSNLTCVLDHGPVPPAHLYLDHHLSHHLHIIPRLNTTTAWEVWSACRGQICQIFLEVA